MTRKIPDDAFERYVVLGPQRSHRALAEELGVSKRAITKCAVREDWAGRLTKIEQTAREKSDQKLTESFEQMRDRHLVTLKAMHTRALTALMQYPIDNGMDAMRAAEMAIKLERLVAGEPTDRNSISIEEITKREMRAWLIPAGADSDDREAAIPDEPDGVDGA